MLDADLVELERQPSEASKKASTETSAPMIMNPPIAA